MFGNMVFILHACCAVVSVSCHFAWSVHDNMRHRSGDLSSLQWCSKGCISNQLLMTNLFDEFDFVQISFGIPARATGPFDWIHFYKSIIVAFVKMTACVQILFSYPSSFVHSCGNHPLLSSNLWILAFCATTTRTTYQAAFVWWSIWVWLGDHRLFWSGLIVIQPPVHNSQLAILILHYPSKQPFDEEALYGKHERCLFPIRDACLFLFTQYFPTPNLPLPIKLISWLPQTFFWSIKPSQ